MSKQIEINVGGQDYILEYDRASIKKMEQMGFSASESFAEKPVAAVEMLFHGALMKHKPFVSREQSNKILDGFFSEYNSSGLVESLIDMMKESLPNGGADSETKKQFSVVG